VRSRLNEGRSESHRVSMSYLARSYMFLVTPHRDLLRPTAGFRARKHHPMAYKAEHHQPRHQRPPTFLTRCGGYRTMLLERHVHWHPSTAYARLCILSRPFKPCSKSYLAQSARIDWTHRVPVGQQSAPHTCSSCHSGAYAVQRTSCRTNPASLHAPGGSSSSCCHPGFTSVRCTCSTPCVISHGFWVTFHSDSSRCN